MTGLVTVSLRATSYGHDRVEGGKILRIGRNGKALVEWPGRDGAKWERTWENPHSLIYTKEAEL